MLPKTLTIVERQILSNQFRILSKLEEDEREYYETKAEILENGYTGKYNEIFTVDHEETPIDICHETGDILNMYRHINGAILNLSPEEKAELNLERIAFEGFDGNNDPHYAYTYFMVEKMNLWREHQNMDLNSHNSLSIGKYKRMLAYVKERQAKAKYSLDKDDLIKLIEIA